MALPGAICVPVSVTLTAADWPGVPFGAFGSRLCQTHRVRVAPTASVVGTATVLAAVVACQRPLSAGHAAGGVAAQTPVWTLTVRTTLVARPPVAVKAEARLSGTSPVLAMDRAAMSCAGPPG